VKRSPIYETEPVQMPGARRFLNLAVAARTRHSPRESLTRLLAVERQLGRTRTRRNTPRRLDLDLLLYGRRIIRRPGLTIPHPRMHERAFVLAPLADIARATIHPKQHCRIRTLLQQVPRTGVRRWPNN